eukprot:CAMPEP_0177688928 /NCGR_PEP_ID=MMETSP0447-20121125/34904_1 /TAXON_ID=0 /ORGANISM="Stygamoeba regulata, Strain BSH-02190019" /LENGTH=123 /DNA_ID=CAMNT_0019199231 /DNA_START=102 /DNA_END=473 /DNA_ORIENTATION=-
MAGGQGEETSGAALARAEKACVEGDLCTLQDCVKTLSPNLRHNHLLTVCCQNGRVNLVKYLLGFESVQKSLVFCDSLDEACKAGNVEIVKLLLSYKELHPATSSVCDENDSVWWASINALTSL